MEGPVRTDVSTRQLGAMAVWLVTCSPDAEAELIREAHAVFKEGREVPIILSCFYQDQKILCCDS